MRFNFGQIYEAITHPYHAYLGWRIKGIDRAIRRNQIEANDGREKMDEALDTGHFGKYVDLHPLNMRAISEINYLSSKKAALEEKLKPKEGEKK